MATINSLNKAVAAAGTAERISSTVILVSELTIIPTSAEVIYIGKSDVDNTVPQIPAAGLTLRGSPDNPINLNDVWLDAGTNGHSADIWYVEE